MNAAGGGDFRVGIIQANVVSNTVVTYRQVERVELFLLGGPDTVLSNDTAVATMIDMGGGDDHIVIGNGRWLSFRKEGLL